MKNIQLVIPAAGLGSRFASVGIDTPKPLIKVLDLPMIAWVIGNFGLVSTDKVIVITRPELGIEEELLSIIKNLVCPVHFVYVNHVTEGPAISVSLAKTLLNMDDALIVANSDQFVSVSLDDFVQEVRGNKADGQILTMNAVGKKWSYVKRDSALRIIEVKEKIEISHEATVGIYGWSTARSFFDSLKLMVEANDRTNGEFYVAPSYNYLINQGKNISGVNIGDVENHVHGLGTPEDLEIFKSQPLQSNFLASVKEKLNYIGN